MKRIKITKGTYRQKVEGTKRSILISIGERAIVSDREAERLIKLGVAIYVSEAAAKPSFAAPVAGIKGENPVDAHLHASAGENGVEDAAIATLDAEQLHTMTNADLKQLAEDMGLDTSKLKTKANYIDAITSVEISPDSSDDEEAPPEVSAEEPVL